MSVAKILALKERRSAAKLLAERVRNAMPSTDDGAPADAKAAMHLNKLTHALILLEEADVRRRQLFISALSRLRVGSEAEADEIERIGKKLNEFDDFSPDPHQSYAQAMAEASTVDPVLVAGANLRLQQFTQAMQHHRFASDDDSNAGESTLQQAVRNLSHYAETLIGEVAQEVSSSQYVGRSA